MARLVLVVEVIDWFDDAAAEELSPQAIDGARAKKGLSAAGDPFGQGDARAGLRLPVGLFSSRNMALAIFLVSAMAISRRSTVSVSGANRPSPCRSMPAKKAAWFQNCSRLQLANG